MSKLEKIAFTTEPLNTQSSDDTLIKYGLLYALCASAVSSPRPRQSSRQCKV